MERVRAICERATAHAAASAARSRTGGHAGRRWRRREARTRQDGAHEPARSARPPHGGSWSGPRRRCRRSCTGTSLRRGARVLRRRTVARQAVVAAAVRRDRGVRRLGDDGPARGWSRPRRRLPRTRAGERPLCQDRRLDQPESRSAGGTVLTADLIRTAGPRRAPAAGPASRSSTFSMPTESRTRSPGTSRAEPATEACVMRPGCSISDSTPPRDSPRVNSLARLQTSTAASSPPVDLEGDHAAEGPHLLGGDLVARVLRQPRVEDLRHPRVPGQHVGDPGGVLAVPVHAHRERLDAAQHQPRVEGPGDRAHRVLVVRQLLAERLVGDDSAPPTTSEWPPMYLVSGVHDDVRAERQRLLEVRAGEGVVDDEPRARVPGDLRRRRRCR